VSDAETIIRLLAVLSVPFLAGVWLGVEIVNRRKKDLEDAHAGLGRTINEIIDQTTSPLRFTGQGVRVTRQIITKRNGVDCKITFEAKL
jgi:hypothetical protein